MSKHTTRERKAKNGLMKAFPTEFQPNAKELQQVTTAVENYKSDAKYNNRKVTTEGISTIRREMMATIKRRRGKK